jgi:hypothetical protein
MHFAGQIYASFLFKQPNRQKRDLRTIRFLMDLKLSNLCVYVAVEVVFNSKINKITTVINKYKSLEISEHFDGLFFTKK